MIILHAVLHVPCIHLDMTVVLNGNEDKVRQVV